MLYFYVTHHVPVIQGPMFWLEDSARLPLHAASSSQGVALMSAAEDEQAR